MFKPNTLKDNHSNLYFGVMGFGLWGIIVGLTTLLTEPLFLHGGWQYAIGTAYIIFGSMKIIGANTGKVDIARAGLVSCMALSMSVAGFALSAYISGEIRSLYSAINFFFLGIIQMAALSEPSVNPLTMKSLRDDK